MRLSLALQCLGALLCLVLALRLARRPRAESGTAQDGFPEPPFVIRSTRVVLPDGYVGPADITVDSEGIIAAVHIGQGSASPESRTVDVSPLVVMPGLIDPHVHINSPGRTDWEGFDSATRAAAAGGTTAILDMPLNNVPSTVSVETLRAKVQAFHAATPVVDVGFIGGIVPQNIEDDLLALNYLYVSAWIVVLGLYAVEMRVSQSLMISCYHVRQ